MFLRLKNIKIIILSANNQQNLYSYADYVFMTIMKEQFLTFAKYLLTNPYANYESVPKIASALGLSESEVKDILSVIYISQNYIGKLDTLEHNKLKPRSEEHTSELQSH